MKETSDPTEVFAQYSEGVTVHEDKTITITPKVQKDILDATAMLMYEVNKLSSILGLFLGVVERGEQDEIEKVCGLAQAVLETPQSVSMMQAGSAEEVTEILNALSLAGLDEDDEVEN